MRIGQNKVTVQHLAHIKCLKNYTYYSTDSNSKYLFDHKINDSNTGLAASYGKSKRQRSQKWGVEKHTKDQSQILLI